ncbi:MAG TPA: type II toxin-antitoxin system RelE/ParE family toxin [Sphingomonas sp.]|nr:type II toxin-antitoxin system RelE/ParE family toxin [Sphingomonas sp.]
MRLIISALASDDLSAIAEFGTERWGEDAARNYARTIHSKLAQLTNYPNMGMADEHHPGFRRLITGSHIAFYELRDDVILIVRVLHGSQEFERHLP